MSNIQTIIHHLRTHKCRLHPIASLQNSQQMPPMLHVLVTSFTNLTPIYYIQTKPSTIFIHTSACFPICISTGLSTNFSNATKIQLVTSSTNQRQSSTIFIHTSAACIPIASLRNSQQMPPMLQIQQGSHILHKVIPTRFITSAFFKKRFITFWNLHGISQM